MSVAITIMRYSMPYYLVLYYANTLFEHKSLLSSSLWDVSVWRRR